MRTVSIKLKDMAIANIQLGFVGENNATQVIFESKEIFDENPYAVQLLVVTPPEGTSYEVTTARIGDNVIWNVSELDTAFEGAGSIQLVFTDGSQVIKTYNADTTVLESQVPSGTAPATALNWIQDAEAWAKGTRGGRAVEDDDPTYQNNSKYYSDKIVNMASDSEAWAKGTRDGEAVESDDPAYHNNAKYYKEQVESMASDSEAFAAGTRGGEAVDEDDTAYHNNASYYNDQAALEAATAAAAAATASAAYNVNLLAPNYTDLTFPVKKGQPCIYSGGYYEALVDIATTEEWTSAHWKNTKVGAEVNNLKSAIDPMLDENYVIHPTAIYGSNNTAMTSNGDGSFVAGTTDYGNSTFGSSMTTLAPGDYVLYGVPQGIAFLTTVATGSTSYNNKVFENISNAPTVFHNVSEVSVCLGYRITAKPDAAVTIYPYLKKLTPKVDRAALMESILPSGTDLNDVNSIGVYFLNSSYTYTHAPNISGGGMLFVDKIGSRVLQTVVQYGSSARTYSANICFRWDNSSAWKYLGRQWGMRTALIGDSITWGRNGNGQATDRTPYIITDAIEHNLGIACDNLGVSGMGWVNEGDGDVIAYDVLSDLTLSDYDAIFFCLGVNDGFKTLGTWDSEDETTVMGQFNKCIKYIMTNRPSLRVIVVAPFNGRNVGSFPDYWYGERNNASGYVSRKVLSDTLKQACDYYWIPYIEQYDSPINPYSIQTLIGSDGVHPSNTGYLAIGQWLSSKINAVL